jgi:hypothetical protein
VDRGGEGALKAVGKASSVEAPLMSVGASVGSSFGRGKGEAACGVSVHWCVLNSVLEVGRGKGEGGRGGGGAWRGHGECRPAGGTGSA